MILILFLISVGVMEIILSKDEKRERIAPKPIAEERGRIGDGPETMTRDLLALAGAMPSRVHLQNDMNTEDQAVPDGVSSMPEYNRVDVRGD